MKAAFFTLGCKVNQYETQNMLESLKASGYEIVSSDDEADVYIINSCTVTSSSDHKTRQAVRHFKRLHPDSAVVLTGCMPQAYPKAAQALSEADIVIGNRNNDELLGSIEEYMLSGKRIFSVRQHEKGEKFSKSDITGFDDRTRAFIKIEDGCDRYCSYCIIPTARGHIRSKPLSELKTELEKVAEAGYLEVVLVGINLPAYGRDTGEKFYDAVSLACSIEGIKRVRLGSLEPDFITDEVIEKLSALSKLCPQFHISLQSGCDSTLKRMNRHYSSEEYFRLCEKLRESFEDTAITTDVMVGFPQESEEEFRQSLEFVGKVGFEKIHVFPYSPRKGTRAAEMPGQISKAEKEKRCHVMIEAGREMRSDFLKKQIGKTVSVLFESKTENGIYEGYTPNYMHVKVKSNENLCSKLLDVKIIGAKDEYCIGTIE